MNRLFYVHKLPWGERKEKKPKPKDKVNHETQQNFQPNHSQNQIPNPYESTILQKFFSCNSSFALAETLTGQRMKFVLPDIFAYVEENRQQKFRINNPWRAHYYIVGQILDSTMLHLFHLTNSREKILLASCQCSKNGFLHLLTCLIWGTPWWQGKVSSRNSPDAVLRWHVSNNESASRGPVDGAQDCSKILGFVRVHFEWFSLHSSFNPPLVQPPPIPTRLWIGLLRVPRLQRHCKSVPNFDRISIILTKIKKKQTGFQMLYSQ